MGQFLFRTRLQIVTATVKGKVQNWVDDAPDNVDMYTLKVHHGGGIFDRMALYVMLENLRPRFKSVQEVITFVNFRILQSHNGFSSIAPFAA
ncbi:hypothetical protein L484_010332 [Morus notabilis]|uniref:Uncharacterized protein n=1 Tax=Morus notabilis TaxID=981085 RepID=W9QNN4_9ROSA|nr:hypothetical protein L484_010332 [Morus notabilis]